MGLHEDFPRLLAALRQVQAEARQQAHVARRATVAFGAAGKVAAQFQGSLLVRGRREHQVGHRGGEIAPALGGAGLHQGNPRLAEGRQVERSLDLEEFAVVVDRAHPGNVGVAAALAVDQECLAGKLSHRSCTSRVNSAARA